MPTKKTKLCVDDLRHNEYYGMQRTIDELYDKSVKGEKFDSLMTVILSEENILLAYRNIKTNIGSKTAGTDKLTIRDIAKLPPEEVVQKVRDIVAGGSKGYTPKPVRRRDIPKNGDPTKTRPLGIPCIWDRLVQQCIKQVLEPICEAKFSEHSHGFRPNRSVEHAVAELNLKLNRSHMRYVIEFDIKGFFDNVDHAKLIRQMWALGIRDKHLIFIIRRILKAPVRMPNGEIVAPDKGTPQGGIISPLLANIVLNELDHWVESNWEENPVVYKYSHPVNANGTVIKSAGYAAMRKTGLKEMYIVRYADDFRILCRNRTDAKKILEAVTQWLQERLHLEVSPEKTKIVNVKKRYTNFLGFQFKLQEKGKKLVAKSKLSNRAKEKLTRKLTEQAKRIARPRPECREEGEIRIFNTIVMGAQSYYKYATSVNMEFAGISWRVNRILQNRLRTRTGGSRLRKEGRPLTKFEAERYGKSAMLRYVAGSDEPIYPIGFVQHKDSRSKPKDVNSYTPEGRVKIHESLRINMKLMRQLMLAPVYGRSVEYADNRISLFSAQNGRCAVTGIEFMTVEEIHCHHKVPVGRGGTDSYENLILVCKEVHGLIHAKQSETIERYLSKLNLDRRQKEKVNLLRLKAGNERI